MDIAGEAINTWNRRIDEERPLSILGELKAALLGH